MPMQWTVRVVKDTMSLLACIYDTAYSRLQSLTEVEPVFSVVVPRLQDRHERTVVSVSAPWLARYVPMLHLRTELLFKKLPGGTLHTVV